MNTKKTTSRFAKTKVVETAKLMLVVEKESPIFSFMQPITWIENKKNNNMMAKTTIKIIEESPDYPDYKEGDLVVYLPTAVVVSRLADSYPNGEYLSQCFTVTQHKKSGGFFPCTLAEYSLSE